MLRPGIVQLLKPELRGEDGQGRSEGVATAHLGHDNGASARNRAPTPFTWSSGLSHFPWDNRWRDWFAPAAFTLVGFGRLNPAIRQGFENGGPRECGLHHCHVAAINALRTPGHRSRLHARLDPLGALGAGRQRERAPGTPSRSTYCPRLAAGNTGAIGSDYQGITWHLHRRHNASPAAKRGGQSALKS